MQSGLNVTQWITTSRGVALSAALTVGIIVVLLLTTGQVAAVTLTIENLAAGGGDVVGGDAADVETGSSHIGGNELRFFFLYRVCH